MSRAQVNEVCISMVTKTRERMDGMDSGGYSFLVRKDVFCMYVERED